MKKYEFNFRLKLNVPTTNSPDNLSSCEKAIQPQRFLFLEKIKEENKGQSRNKYAKNGG